MTAKPSQRGNDDSEVLKFKDLQGPLTSNSKTFKPYSIFKDFPGPGKMEKDFKDFQELSRPCGHPAKNTQQPPLVQIQDTADRKTTTKAKTETKVTEQ